MIPPFQPPPVPKPTFTGAPPTPTPYGTFTAPIPGAMGDDTQYLFDTQQKAIQRSAAARGTLLTGGLLKQLQANGTGLAAQDYGNQFNRALQTYTANRDTNAQNFGQQQQQFQGSLSAFGANTGAGFDAYDRTYQAVKDTHADQQQIVQASQQQQLADQLFAQQRQQEIDRQDAARAAAAAAQNAATSAATGGRTAAPIGAVSRLPGWVPRR
jgi:hypothetical protein